jgi:LDH2 family malate/lactate/ureidoglycolate dehydrogenase
MNELELIDVLESNYDECIIELLTNEGCSLEHARMTAEALKDADLTGVHTHGIFRLRHYVEQIRNGDINIKPNFQWNSNDIVHKLDADHALGSVAAHIAITKTVQIAKTNGVALMTVNRSNHFGTAAYYSNLASKEGMVGFVASTSSKTIAPTGSKTPLLGNNPWSVSLPTFDGPPITIDMANSVVARGKIRLANLRGEKIPLGWALDSYGNPTEDPQEALKGIVLPMGDHKGYGISLIIEILAGIMAGADFGEDKVNLDEAGKRNVGHVMFAVSIEKWLSLEEYKMKINQLMDSIKSAEKVNESSQIWLPGEIEAAKKQNQRPNMIRLPRKNWETIKKYQLMIK